MTEQEIIDYLKTSEKAPILWPDKVKEWAREKRDQRIWEWATEDGPWGVKWQLTSLQGCYTTSYRLIAGYEKQEDIQTV